MIALVRGSMSVAGVAAVALVLAACQTSGSNTANLNTIGAPSQLQPVQNSTVQQGSLPPIGATGAPAPGLSGQPVLGGVPPSNQMASAGGMTPAPGGFPSAPTSFPPAGQTSSIVTMNGAGSAGVATGPEGVWNVTAGSTACRLNLPRTEKTGTSYFRASAPGCAVPGIAAITGWQQVGSQLQLYDENGNIAAFLAPNAGRYVGTMGGGQAISMSR